MRAIKHFGLFTCLAIIALLGPLSELSAEGPTVAPPLNAAELFVIPQNMEKAIREVLPDDMEISGGYRIGNMLVEESTILVEFNRVNAQGMKVRLGHPTQLENNFAVTGKFALRLEEGDPSKLKAALDDLARHISISEKNWQWRQVNGKVENYRDHAPVGTVPPECAEPLKIIQSALSASVGQSGLLTIYAENKTGHKFCDGWLLVEITNKADSSTAESLAPMAEEFRSDASYNYILHSIASVFQRCGQNEKAMKIWDRLAEHDPDFSPAAIPLYIITVMLGYKDEDMLRYAERLKKNPADHTSDLMLGVLKYYRRDYAGALPHFQRSAEVRGLRREAAVFLVMTCYFLNRKEEARHFLDSFLKEPERSNRLYYCQAVLLLENDPDQAIEYLTKFIESHGIRAEEARQQSQLDVKEAWDLINYIKNRREDPSVEIFAPIDMQAPWPPVNVINMPSEIIQKQE